MRGLFGTSLATAVLAGLTVCLGAAALYGAESSPAPTDHKFALAASDVVAFVGGADVAAAQQGGHFETLLMLHARGRNVRFRNFGWEGDTVFSQPREVGFPPVEQQLEAAKVTVIFLQYGRSEALDGATRAPEFTRAYASMIDRCQQRNARVVLIAPPPFEKAPAPLPDLSSHNGDLASYVNAIRELARTRHLPFVDSFSTLLQSADTGVSLTENGLQLSARGHALVATACARELGLTDLVTEGGAIDERGAWSNASFERVRQAIIGKNRLWFDYSRPQNWAFLGGDRITQPSSRDHRDPKIRWFPTEMQQFLPLIEAKETEIRQLAQGLSR